MSKNSFEKINFRIRPSKNIERKMFLEILRRLAHIHSLDDYQYVGMGGIYFVDCRLFHKRLGINKIISIEKEQGKSKRFNYNNPFDCIEIKFGHSTEELPKLDWEQPTILWLDYDTGLKPYMFSDIKQFLQSAVPGSVIFVTVNADTTNISKFDNDDYPFDDRFEELKDDIGRENIPPNVKDEDLRGWDKADVYKKILEYKIQSTLDIHNGGLPNEEKKDFRQLVNFRYQDSAKMMTYGGILYSDNISEGYEEAHFEKIPHVQKGTDVYKIKTPKLTFAEMRGLDKELPTKNPKDIDIPVPAMDKKEYSNIYRYFPRFAEANF